MREPAPERRKRHHTIPKLLLRNFAGDDGRLFEYDLDLLKRNLRTPGQVGHTKDIYTIQTPDGPSDEVEKLLARFEDSASSAVRKLLPPGEPLSVEEWDSLILLVALQGQRVPAERARTIDFIDRSEDMARKVAESQGLDPDEATTDLHSDLEFTRSRDSMNQLMLISLTVTYRLMRPRGWGVLRRHADAPRFIIADDPVVITDLRPDTGPPYTPLIPFGENSKIVMPISPDVALVSYYEPEMSRETLVEGIVVGLVNWQQLQNAQRRVYAHEEDFSFGVGEQRLLWADYVAYQERVRRLGTTSTAR